MDLPISLHLCLATMTCVHSLSYETHDRSGAPNGRGPRFLEPAEPAIATPLVIIKIMRGLKLKITHVCDKFTLKRKSRQKERPLNVIQSGQTFTHKLIFVTSEKCSLVEPRIFNF